MIQLLLTLALLSSSIAQAQGNRSALSASVKEVTSEYQFDLGQETIAIAASSSLPSTLPTPAPNKPKPKPEPATDIGRPTLPSTGDAVEIAPDLDIKVGGVDLDKLITLGSKVWDFVVNNKPNADYKIVKTSILPSGITSWTQLTGWKRPISKVYRVEFKDIFGHVAGSFDYRITYVAGGGYNGKGKFLGEISFVPMNIKLRTDRSLTVRAELSDPLNYGTEEDPVAAAQMIVTWSSPTTPRFQMNSAEFFIYGTGEIDNLTNGN